MNPEPQILYSTSKTPKSQNFPQSHTLKCMHNPQSHIRNPEWGFPKIKGYHFRGPHNKDYSILGSIFGFPYLEKLLNISAAPEAQQVLGAELNASRGAGAFLGFAYLEVYEYFKRRLDEFGQKYANEDSSR